MVAGETHEAGSLIFPPIPETIIGALRTAILAQRGIDPKHIKDDQPLSGLPFWGTPEKPGFGIVGPLLKAKGVVLFPAPASWFYFQPEKDKPNLLVYEARPVGSEITPEETPPVKLPRNRSLWVKAPPEDIKPLSGRFWLTRKALENEGHFTLREVRDLGELSEDKALAVPTSLLIKTEERVGIARDNFRRTVKTGHLYAARHLRLERDVSLLVGLDSPLCPSHLNEKGVFQLGGEGRLVRYGLLPKDKVPQFPKTGSGRFMALSPLPYSRAEKAGLLTGPYASGKLLRVAGWDMKKGFHKPARAYFPAGAVFYAEKDPELCELMPF